MCACSRYSGPRHPWEVNAGGRRKRPGRPAEPAAFGRAACAEPGGKAPRGNGE